MSAQSARVQTPVAFALLLLGPALLLAGCGMLGGLEKRAATYYNYMIGRYPQQAYSSYLSPAYKKKFTPADLRQLDESRRKGSKPNTRYPLAKGKDLLILEQEKFAWTAVDPALGDAFAVLQPQRWVKVGTNWYLYSGSEAEIAAYGTFPSDFAPPPLIEFEKRREAEYEKQKARAGNEEQGAKSDKSGSDADPEGAKDGAGSAGDGDG